MSEGKYALIIHLGCGLCLVGNFNLPNSENIRLHSDGNIFANQTQISLKQQVSDSQGKFANKTKISLKSAKSSAVWSKGSKVSRPTTKVSFWESRSKLNTIPESTWSTVCFQNRYPSNIPLFYDRFYYLSGLTRRWIWAWVSAISMCLNLHLSGVLKRFPYFELHGL